jgi:hypothetical protein
MSPWWWQRFLPMMSINPCLRFQPCDFGLPSITRGGNDEVHRGLSDLYARSPPVANNVLQLHYSSRSITFRRTTGTAGDPGRHRREIGIVDSVELPAQSGFFLREYEAGDCHIGQKCVPRAPHCLPAVAVHDGP